MRASSEVRRSAVGNGRFSFCGGGPYWQGRVLMFRTSVDVESLEKAASGAIWGAVWHEFEGQAFPERRWNDMVVPYLTALALGVRDAGEGRPGEVLFFDGPYRIEVRPQGDVLEIVPGGPGVDIASCAVERVTLWSGVREAGQLVLEACERSGWGDDHDVRQLRSSLWE